MRSRQLVAALILAAAGTCIWVYRGSSPSADVPTVVVNRVAESQPGQPGRRQFHLTIEAQFDTSGRRVNVTAALPSNGDRQSVRQESFQPEAVPALLQSSSLNRSASWRWSKTQGKHSMSYDCDVVLQARQYAIPRTVARPPQYPTELRRDLLPTTRIQSNAAEIKTLYEKLVSPADRSNVTATVTAAYNYAADDIKTAPYEKGADNALAALNTGRGACGAKSRLLVAICRAAGVPARAVGGVILRDGEWQIGHMWAEIWINGEWVPFCPTNRHFAEIPANYLALYYGSMPLFRHSANIEFQYVYRARELPADAQLPTGPTISRGAYEIVTGRMELLKTLLALPIGALVVVFFRHFIGIRSFGTFMPALMAVSFRVTGLFWGVGLFLAILGFGSIVRAGLKPLRLMQAAKMGIVLTFAVLFITVLTLVSEGKLESVSSGLRLFPIVILSLTVERFWTIQEEADLTTAFKILLGTLVTVMGAYVVINIHGLLTILMRHPELLLIVVGLMILVGRWNGMRLMEYIRFRQFLTDEEPH